MALRVFLSIAIVMLTTGWARGQVESPLPSPLPLLAQSDSESVVLPASSSRRQGLVASGELLTLEELARDNAALRAEVNALRASVESLAGQPPSTAQAPPPDLTTSSLQLAPPSSPWQKGAYRIVPYGKGWVNIAYDTSRTQTGAYAVFAQSKSLQDEPGFAVNARASRFGTDVTGPEIFGARSSGKLEFDFFGSAQIENRAGILLRHAYGEFVGENWRAVGGQTSDVISPLVPNMLNYTVGWGGGNIGYRRAQSRFEWWQDIAGSGRLSMQGSLNQTIVTDFATDPLTGGQDAGWPTFMGRIAFRPEWSTDQCDFFTEGSQPQRGHLEPGTGTRPELGVSSHIGSEQVDFASAPVRRNQRFTSWSLNVDLYAPLTDSFGFQGEFFWGDVLGTFQGGIIQGINPALRRGIRSIGGWGELWYEVTDRVHTHVGFGIDDPRNSDLSTGLRSQNHFWFGNAVFDVTKMFTVGLEVSYWKTKFVGLNDGEAVRIETVMKYRF